MKKYLFYAICIFAAVSLISAEPSKAQILAGLTLEKLGVLTVLPPGARPLAMGGAYTASGNDLFSLFYNPAGLAELEDREFSIGLRQRSDEIVNFYRPLKASQSSSSTSLDHIAAAFPYPTYRGSLVFAFGVFRTGSSQLESVKSAYLSDIEAESENMYVQSGTIYKYCLGAAVDISPRVSIGASLAIWDESLEFSDEIEYADRDSQAHWRDDVSLDLDGVSFDAGVLLRISENLRAGFSFTSPVWLSYDGSGITSYSGSYTSGGGWDTEPEYGLIEDDYTLPIKWNAGLAATLPLLTIAADVTYCDWSETKFNGLAIRSEIDPGKRKVLEATWGFRAGMELRLPMAPISIRGGYSYAPLELSSVEEIAYISNDAPLSQIADFEIKRQRRFWSIGMGAVIDRVFSLDFAAVIGGYKKTTPNSDNSTLFEEERNITELVFSGSYRF